MQIAFLRRHIQG